MTRVSVLIPARDHARHLGEAIASALAQDVDGVEVIVHDDASTDATPTVVAALADPRLRYLRHRARLGVTRNRDSLVAAARAPVIAWLDADDALLPGALARQVALLQRHPQVALAHGAFHVVGDDGRRLPDWRAPLHDDAVEPSAAAFANLLAGNEVTTSTVVMRRAAYVSGLPPRTSSSDWALWLRAALRGDFAYGAAPVARYRQHANTISRRTAAGGTRLRCDIVVLGELLRHGRVPARRAAARIARAALAAKALRHAGDLLTRGERAASLRAVALAAGLDPAALGRLSPRLLACTARGDLLGCLRADRMMRAQLAPRLEGTRAGDRLRAAAAGDPAWEATLARAAATLRRVVPAHACVGAVAKWDPTLLALSGHRGRNFPDRRALPDGYPRDGAAAVAHLDEQRRAGLSHLAFTSASLWWLEHYRELADELGEPLHRDAELAVYELQ
ncbi:MAG TPA: glycosyltransferase [Solirubrobacteraceae bacterium]|nr:glycosyltransferase [Solirubrobacteraceae bacterium]